MTTTSRALCSLLRLALAGLIALAWAAPAAVAQEAPDAEPDATAPAPPPGDPQEYLFEDIVAWVNDDIVLLSDLIEREQAIIAQLLQQQNLAPEEIEGRLGELRQSILLQLVWDRLLVQEAEKHFSIEGIRRELIEQFMKRNGIPSLTELDGALREQFGMTREELGDRLLMRSAPDYVVQMIVMPRLGVSEEKAREHYDENVETFTTPASVTFRELVLLESSAGERAARREEAQRLVERARAGEDFVALIREHSEAASKGIDGLIGPVAPSDLIPGIAEALMAAEPGVVADPVETDQGLHLLLVEEREDARRRPFEEVRAECEDAVRRGMLETEYREFVEGLWSESVVEVRSLYAEILPPPWRGMTEVRD